MHRLVLMLLFTLAAAASSAAETPQSVYIHAECDGNVFSAVASSFMESIRISRNYRQVPNLEDEGRRGIVMTIYMSCTERNDVIGIATSYGWAKCYGDKVCHLSLDGSSIRSVLCDPRAAAECGRTLFKILEDFIKNAEPSRFKL
jgi:hypothetical protein